MKTFSNFLQFIFLLQFYRSMAQWNYLRLKILVLVDLWKHSNCWDNIANSGKVLKKFAIVLNFSLFSVFGIIYLISRVYLPLVANKSFSRPVRKLMNILNCIKFRLQVKSFKSFSNDFFSSFDYFRFSTLRFCLFAWDCSIDLLVRKLYFSDFHSIMNCILGLVLLCFLWDIFTPFFMTLSFQNGINR